MYFVTVSWHPKTYIPRVRIGTPPQAPTPLPQASVSLPNHPRTGGGGWHTRLRVRGEGVQIGRLERTPSTLSTLWFLLSVSRACDIFSGIGLLFPLAASCVPTTGRNYIFQCNCLILSVHTQLIWAGSVTAEAVPKTN